MSYRDRARNFANQYAREFKQRPDIGVATLGIGLGSYAPYIGGAVGAAKPKGEDGQEIQEPNLGDRVKGAAKGFVDQIPTALAIAGAGLAAGAGLNLAAKYAKKNPESVRKAGEAVGNAYRGAKETVSRGVEKVKDIRRPAGERTVDTTAQAAAVAMEALPVGKRGGDLVKRSANPGVQMADLSGGADIQKPSTRDVNASTGEMAPNVQEFNALNRAGELGESLVDREFRQKMAEMPEPPADYQVGARKVSPEVQAYVEQKRSLASPDASESQLNQAAATERVLGDLAPRGDQSPKTSAGSFAQGYVQEKGYVDSSPISQGYKASSTDDYQANRAEMRELRRNEDIDLTAVDARVNPDYDAATPELSDTAVENIQPAEYETVSNFETSARDPDTGEQINIGVRTTRPVDLTGGDEMPEVAREVGESVIARLKEENEERRATARRQLEERGMPVTPSRVEKYAAENIPTKRASAAEQESTISSLTKQTQFNADTGRKTTTYTYTQEVPEGMQEIASGGERAVSNFGPDAKIEKTAAGRAIKGGSRMSETMGPVERTRQMESNPDALTTPIPDTGEDRLMPTQQQYGEVGNYPEGVKPRATYTQRVTDPSLLSDMGKLPDPDPGRGTGIYGYEKNYTAGAIDRSTGDFTAAAEQKPSIVMKKFEPGTEGMSYPRQVESARAREIGYPDAGDRQAKIADAQARMEANPPGGRRYARAEETVTDLTEGAAKRKASAQLAAKVRDIQMRVNPAQQADELAKLGIGRTAGPSVRGSNFPLTDEPETKYNRPFENLRRTI